MKMIPFANTQEQVSQMCLGTMMFGGKCDEAEAGRIMRAALDGGVNFFDTASMYAEGRTEEIMGRQLKGLRDRVFLATKVNVPEGPEYPAQIGPSLDASLKRLQTDRVDLYIIHWARVNMDPAAMIAQLDKVVRAGKARYVGCSNFPAWLLAHFNRIAIESGGPRLVSNQIPYNLIERGAEVEVLPQAKAEKIAINCYRPLVGGALSGKYRPGVEPPADSRAVTDARIPNWVKDNAAGLAELTKIAKARGVAESQVAIAWLKDRPGVSCPIVGVSKLEQLTSGIGAFGVTLDEAEVTSLAAAFDTDVKEISQFYGPLRRSFDLLAK